VVDLDEGLLLSKVLGPDDEYDLNDPKSLCFGCDVCDGHDDAISNTIQNREPEMCRHREAVITVLKRKHNYDTSTDPWKKHYNANGWVINFVATPNY
jgi:hypothetical protein